jgi:hypothetical protein
VNGIQTSMHNNVPVHYLVGNATNSIIEIGPPDPIQGPCGTGSVNAGTPPPFFCDTMEGGDGNWSHMALPGDTAGDDWALIATPNASSGTTAWFSADVAIIKDVALDSVPQAVPAGGATLRFKHVFNMETGFDGCVLEASIDGGAFVDLGAQIVEGGYTVAAISTGLVRTGRSPGGAGDGRSDPVRGFDGRAPVSSRL